MPKIQEHANTFEAEERGRTFRPHKKKFSLSSYPAKKCHAGGRADFSFFFFYIYFLLSVPLLLKHILK